MLHNVVYTADMVVCIFATKSNKNVGLNVELNLYSYSRIRIIQALRRAVDNVQIKGYKGLGNL